MHLFDKDGCNNICYETLYFSFSDTIKKTSDLIDENYIIDVLEYNFDVKHVKNKEYSIEMNIVYIFKEYFKDDIYPYKINNWNNKLYFIFHELPKSEIKLGNHGIHKYKFRSPFAPQDKIEETPASLSASSEIKKLIKDNVRALDNNERKLFLEMIGL